MIAESTLIRPLHESLFHRRFTGLRDKHAQHSKSISPSLATRRSSLSGRHENVVLADSHESQRMPNLSSSTLSDIQSGKEYPQSSSNDARSSDIVETGSNSKTSNGTGRDPQAFDPFNSDQMKDEDLWHFRNGPLPGDLAEVEAFCRIFRVAEQVHKAVMEALRVVSDSRERVDGQSSSTNGAARYDVEQQGDVPLLEEKVVSSLACIGALLHQQKQEVLTGRFGLGSTTIAGYNSIPPLAQFRANMKRCCEQLEALLLCYFPVDDPQFTMMHKNFQKLQNVCFDAGYPRVEGSPSHADIPNWGPVHSLNQNKEIERDVAFWRGGQLTDDGINWLINKGFKVVVDLRGEDTGHHLAKSTMAAAVSSGKLKHITLPVERGSIPSREQVIEFSKIVMNVRNRPLYLHSQEGVGRTSSMVAKWRETGFLTVPEEDIASTSLSKNDANPNVFDREFQNPSTKQAINHVPVEALNNQGAMKKEDFPPVKPFEAQRPPANVFSRIEMSKFFKGRQVTPTSFRQNRGVKRTIVTVIQGDEAVISTVGIEEPAGRWGLDGPGIPRAGKKEEDLKKDKEVVPEQKASALRRVSENGSLVENDNVTVVGDMCASTTGVVRVQSRKKAEMYLVRTDGFSCTRERVKESTLAFTHPSTQQQMLMWKTAPKTVLLLKKLGPELMQEAELVSSFLHHKEGMNVIVEPDVHDHFARVSGFGFVQTFYNQDISLLHERVDFVVCLGGDGVILHASNLFRDAVPPVVSFNLGSLGFLTAHPFEDFMQDLRTIIHGNTSVEGVYITLRMRLRCEIFRNGIPVPGKIFDVLNEVVVDRGSNPYLCKIECYERNRLITKVQADGVIIATPTGSTAYSTAAGGSMVHPNVPCMLFTPICPHSLSFRPVILPDSALLELKVPEDARSNAWVSFDGKKRQQLSRGDSVRICMSQHPLPTINKSDQTDDWFQSLVRCLNWNERLEQKPLTSHIRE